MKKNPIMHAVLAAAYVVGVVLLIHLTAQPDTPDSIVTPMLVLSLATLSAAVMAYLFFYQPVTMLLDGKRAEAVRFFLTTLATFAGFTALIYIASFLLAPSA